VEAKHDSDNQKGDALLVLFVVELTKTMQNEAQYGGYDLIHLMSS